jgi:hypothetical protein
MCFWPSCAAHPTTHSHTHMTSSSAHKLISTPYICMVTAAPPPAPHRDAMRTLYSRPTAHTHTHDTKQCAWRQQALGDPPGP